MKFKTDMKKSLLSTLILGSFLFGAPLVWANSSEPISADTLKEAALYKTGADEDLRAGRIPTSIERYQKALTLDPNLEAAYFNLAIAHYAERNISGAADALEKLLKLSPDDAEAHYNLACLQVYQQDTQSALNHLRDALNQCKPSSPFRAQIVGCLTFVKQLKTLDPSAQAAMFTLLQKGLDPIPFPASQAN